MKPKMPATVCAALLTRMTINDEMKYIKATNEVTPISTGNHGNV